MTRYTLTIREPDFAALTSFLFTDTAVEQAALLRCRLAASDEEARFLVRAVEPFTGADLNYAAPDGISITSAAFMRVLKQADANGEAVVLVHTHPCGEAFFSPQDDRTEGPFFRTAFVRVEGAPAHGSFVFATPETFVGRAWIPDGTTSPIDVIRVIGQRWRFLAAVGDEAPIPPFFDRQVRAFGPDLQRTLGRLHIGVVGAGGTGSPTVEQLTRLGVGMITVVDDQTLEGANLNRVYNAGLADVGSPKVEIAARAAAAVGFGTRIRVVQGRVTERRVAELLRSCDILMGCTDDHWGRSVLNALALQYLIPLIDMGVKITADAAGIRQVFGRVTTVLPGGPCLACLGRIDPAKVREESLPDEERARLQAQGYVEDFAEPDPAVITFTTATSASAVTELLHRLTGFMGDDEAPAEQLTAFAERRMVLAPRAPGPECRCQRPSVWGAGDTRLFLGMTWPEQ